MNTNFVLVLIESYVFKTTNCPVFVNMSQNGVTKRFKFYLPFKDKMRQIGIFDPLRVKKAWRPEFFFFLVGKWKNIPMRDAYLFSIFSIGIKKQIRPIILHYKRLSSSCNEGPYGVHILGLPTHDFSWRGLRQMLEEWMQTKKGQVNL